MVRYSGAPLAMGFNEVNQRKSVCLVDFQGTAASVARIDVPVFQRLARVTGDWQAISTRLNELVAAGSDAWLEVVYTGDEIIGDLRERLDTAVAATDMEILRVQNPRVIDRVLGRIHAEESLDELHVEEVFERCLAAHEVPDAQRPELRDAFRETRAILHESDTRAE